MDLSDLNLSSWAGLVQDVASGLLVLLPNLGSNMGLPAVALLELLEKATGWEYCCYWLPPRLQVYLHGSLLSGTPSVMEPGSGSVTWVRSDRLLRRHDRS